MASKSKRRRKVLGASCILAALIIAGSSFAWFTSKDEVTNRLSANADYGVSIVESFAPPANWLPGADVNKDVYAVNTGSIGAFVEEKVSGRLAITKVNKVTPTITNGKITAGFPEDSLTEKVEVLTSDEVYAMEAGAFLAYKPDGSTNVLGNQIIAFKNDGPIMYYNVNDKNEPAKTQTEYDALTDEQKKNYVAVNKNATDFAPTTEGLYIFRRAIDVANDKIETFEYAGYYFKDGVYYKISDLAITSDDRIDLADDNDFTDGYVKSATFKLLQDVSEVVTPDLEYDSMNNRLIAKYGTKGTSTAESTLKTLAQTLDQKEHELAAARAQLDRSILDLGKSDANVQNAMNKVAQLEAEKKAVQDRINELTTTKNEIDAQVTTLNGTAAGSVSKAKDDADNALKKLYGASVTTATLGAVTDGKVTYAEPVVYDASLEDSTLKALLKAQKDLDDAKVAYGDSTFAAYASELKTKFSTTATDYDGIIAELTYAELTGSSAPTFDATSAAELHDINAKTVALLSAKEAYATDKKDAENKVADWNNKKNKLGEAGIPAVPATTSTTDTVAGESITYDKTNANTGSTGLLGQQNELAAEIATLNAKNSALDTAIANQRAAAATAAQATSGTDVDAKAQLEREKTEYNNAFVAYETALNDYNSAKSDYDSQNKQLLIYINLADVVTVAGEKDKWQLLPTTVDPTTDTAVFYYTGILDSSETSSKLIDSVELDKNATQDMYKSFDFDLNVELKSAQITYADDQKTIKTDAAVDELDATPTLLEPTNIETAVKWS